MPVLLNPSRFTIAGSGYDAAVLADSPAAFYKLADAASQTTMADSSGNSHNGIYSSSSMPGATGILTGSSDTCADFASNYAGVTGADWMDTTTTVTFEAIIRPDTVSAGSYNFIGQRDDGNGTGNQWWLVIKAKKLTALCRGSEFSGATDLVANTTYHVAFKYDGTNANVYLNGTADRAAVSATGSMSVANNDLQIGRWSNAGSPLYFDGRISRAAYYTTALSDARIAAHAALR